jgi:hypothetical protein
MGTNKQPAPLDANERNIVASGITSGVRFYRGCRRGG